MKVLIYDTTCAFLTPGGKTVHAIKMQQEIANCGVDIQFAQWWNMSQMDADIIHFFTPSISIAKLAKERGMKTFCSQILDFESNKSDFSKRLTMMKNFFVDRLPRLSSSGAYWKAFSYMDKIHFMHKFDKETALRYFPNYIEERKTTIIPHAYDPLDIHISCDLKIEEMGFPKKYLISCANISPRKQTVKLARLAKKTQVPIVFIGCGVNSDPYFIEFQNEVDNKYVFYPGYVSREWKDCIENHASGFVLLSKGESGCISVYEAAAYKMPILLSDLPWAWGYDNPSDIYFCSQQNDKLACEQLNHFFDISGKLDHFPFHAMTWREVAELYVKEYDDILKRTS